jgi:hypothetical protein
LLAERGKQFTEFETRLCRYYQWQEKLRQIQSGKKPEGTHWTDENTPEAKAASEAIALNNRAIQQYAEQDRVELCKILLGAIDKRKSGVLFEFAKAVESLKTVQTIDRYRPGILTWKWLLDKQGEKLTIQELTQILCWRGMKSEKKSEKIHRQISGVVKSDDGFSQLRRLCRELDFPLKPSRRGRKSLIVHVQPAKSGSSTRHTATPRIGRCSWA